MTLPTRCWAEISRAALIHNVRTLRTLGPDIMAVVKADAYGHGVRLIAPELAISGIRHFGVATVEEGVLLRSLPGLESASIYLMASVLPEESEAIVEFGLIPFVTDTNLLRAIGAEATLRGKTAKVHVEVDTGIGRAGIRPDQLCTVLKMASETGGVEVAGICTHFTAADADDGSRDALEQLRLFERTLEDLDDAHLAGLTIHAANSPASLRVPMAGQQLIRPGLLIYGIAPTTAFEEGFAYRPVLSLHARALLVRRLPAGTDISYSRTYRLRHQAVIITAGIGYGDGFPRRLSNAGWALGPDGERLPIRGRVCMDQLCLEFPGSCTMTPGGTVTFIGERKASTITAAGIAELINTTSHEITTCLTSRIPRIWVNDGDDQ